MTKRSTPDDSTTHGHGYGRRWWNFAREIWNDHDFWIRALAVKGGASAIVVAGAAGIAYALDLPVVLAALAISACTGLIIFGLYGVVVGAASANDKLADVYARTIRGKPRAERPRSILRLHDRLAQTARMQRLMERPLVKKFRATRAWLFISQQIRKEQNIFLAGLAGTSSAIWGIVSAIALAAILPALAIGSIFTFSTIAALGGLMSGVYGVYVSVQSLINHLRGKKHERKD